MCFVNKCPECNKFDQLEYFGEVHVCKSCGSDFTSDYIYAYWKGYNTGYIDCIEKLLPLPPNESDLKLKQKTKTKRLSDKEDKDEIVENDKNLQVRF